MATTAQARLAAKQDTIGHSGVQPWSAGSIFPAVIMQVEKYDDEPFGWAAWPPRPLADRLIHTTHVLILDGHQETYATYADAEYVAKRLISEPMSRLAWRGVPNVSDGLAAYNAACERSVREGLTDGMGVL